MLYSIQQDNLLIPLNSLADREDKKRNDYALGRQFNEKPGIIRGCPGHRESRTLDADTN